MPYTTMTTSGSRLEPAPMPNGFVRGAANPVPEISRFFGIVVRMDVDGAERRPHVRATWQDSACAVAIEPLEVLSGTMPARPLRLLEAWIEIHRDELLTDWARLEGGRTPQKIDPLR